MAKKKRKGSKYAKTLMALAVELGLARPALYEYRQRGMPAEKTKRGYSVDRARRWLQANVRQRNDSERQRKEAEADDTIDYQLKEAQLRRRQHDAELAEIKLRIQRGELVELEEVKAKTHQQIAFVKENLLALARRVAPEVSGLTPRDAERVLRERFSDMMDTFADPEP